MASKLSDLCAYNALTRQWMPYSLERLSKVHNPVSPRSSIRKVNKGLTLTSWNIDAFSARPTIRASRILGAIFEQSQVPDITFFQEVKNDVYDSILRDERVRAGFFATDAKDRTAFQGVPFATVALLSRSRFTLGRIENSLKHHHIDEPEFSVSLAKRVKLPSKYERDGLVIDVQNSNERVIRLINVHFDSLADAIYNRVQQMKVLTQVLCNGGCTRGIIAGDFNAISPTDHSLVDENGLCDQWIALHGKGVTGYTWGVWKRNFDGVGPGRLDKVATIGLQATGMEILRPGTIKVPRPGKADEGIPWSDHCGLTCSFSI